LNCLQFQTAIFTGRPFLQVPQRWKICEVTISHDPHVSESAGPFWPLELVNVNYGTTGVKSLVPIKTIGVPKGFCRIYTALTYWLDNV